MAQKIIPTSFYLNPAQKEQVLKEAREAKLSLSEYLRRKVLGDNYRDKAA